jgi:Ni,Fe-hydrogenase III large subunit
MKFMDQILVVPNGGDFPLADCPVVPIESFRQTILDSVDAGARLAVLFARPNPDGNCRLFAALARADQGDLAVLATDVGKVYEAITPDCPQAHRFEREIFEQCQVEPAGHPWLKPVRFPNPQSETCGVTDFFQMEGEEVHEVAVGPVHAGIIEPGHFRFQCHGETVYHLEISLGYQHRGVERAMVGGPGPRTLPYIETLAGDSTAAHTAAYCRAVEALSATRVPARAQFVRGIALELERVANHIGDLGAMAGDIGFLPTMSYCGRIRGDVLNMTATLCGNRFGRGLIRPGGVAFDIDDSMVEPLERRLAAVSKDVHNAVELLWDSPSVMARFDGIGTIPLQVCEQLGLVGVAARACGIARDVRRDFPYGLYRFAHIPVSTWHTGDVFARANVRWLEVQRSLAFLAEQLDALPEKNNVDSPAKNRPLAPDHGVVTLIEGWRGEICHVAMTGNDGRFTAYKVVDPSFHNWSGLAMALRGQQISDFPLCNKSFNLSYCGHDL